MNVVSYLLGAGLVLGSASSPAFAGSRFQLRLDSCPGAISAALPPAVVKGCAFPGRAPITLRRLRLRLDFQPAAAKLPSGSLLEFPSFRPPRQDTERTPLSDDAFKYTFENPRFYIPWIQLDLSPDGVGTVKFRRGESDDTLDRPVKLMPSTLSRIGELLARTGFLSSDEDYQSKRDFAHLGWMTIAVNQGGKQRTVRFNYTERADMAELADIFRAIANQAIALFDLDLAIQHQPMDLPRLIESLENELRLERYAEPEQLIPALRNIAQDDTLPLIARNNATRLIGSIQKGKFKSPMKAK